MSETGARQAGEDTPPGAGARLSWREVGLAALLSVLLVAANGAYVAQHLGAWHRARQVKETDHHNYIAMTRALAFGRHTPAAKTAPYCWRILVPALAAAGVHAGATVNAAYRAITGLSLVFFLLVLYVLLRRQGLGGGLAALGLILVALTPSAVRWYVYQVWMTDPAAMMLVALGVLLVEGRRWRTLAAVSIAAILVRETYALVFVYAFVREWRRHDLRRAALRVACVAAVPAVLLVLLRLLITPEVGGGLLATLRFSAGFRWRHLFDNQVYFTTIGTFGVLLPLILLFPRRAWETVRRSPEIAAFLLLTYASLFLAVNTDRLLVYALPVLLPPALRAFAALSEAVQLRASLLGGLVISLQAVFYVETQFRKRGISIYQPTSWTVTLTLAAFFALALLALWLAGRRAASPAGASPAHS